MTAEDFLLEYFYFYLQGQANISLRLLHCVNLFINQSYVEPIMLLACMWRVSDVSTTQVFLGMFIRLNAQILNLIES